MQYSSSDSQYYQPFQQMNNKFQYLYLSTDSRNTLFAICPALKPYFSYRSAGGADSGNTSFNPILVTFFGYLSVKTSEIAVPNPPTMEWSSIEDTVEDYGESIFKSTRELYETHNFMMSVMLEMTARSRKQGIKITSRDGQKTLEEDPYQEGTEISLAQGENV